MEMIKKDVIRMGRSTYHFKNLSTLHWLLTLKWLKKMGNSQPTHILYRPIWKVEIPCYLQGKQWKIREVWYQQEVQKLSYCFNGAPGEVFHGHTMNHLCWCFVGVRDLQKWFLRCAVKWWEVFAGLQKCKWHHCFKEIQIEIRTWLRMAGSSFVRQMPQGPKFSAKATSFTSS